MRTLSLLVGCWMLGATCLGEGALSSSPPPLTNNVTIHIRGSVTEDSAVDIQLSGVGPQFTCSIADPVAARFLGTVLTTGDGKLTLDYVLNVSVPVKGAGGVQYREFALQGRVSVPYGEEIKIATINGKDFILAVTKYTKAKK